MGFIEDSDTDENEQEKSIQKIQKSFKFKVLGFTIFNFEIEETYG